MLRCEHRRRDAVALWHAVGIAAERHVGDVEQPARAQASGVLAQHLEKGAHGAFSTLAVPVHASALDGQQARVLPRDRVAVLVFGQTHVRHRLHEPRSRAVARPAGGIGLARVLLEGRERLQGVAGTAGVGELDHRAAPQLQPLSHRQRARQEAAQRVGATVVDDQRQRLGVHECGALAQQRGHLAGAWSRLVLRCVLPGGRGRQERERDEAEERGRSSHRFP